KNHGGNKTDTSTVCDMSSCEDRRRFALLVQLSSAAYRKPFDGTGMIGEVSYKKWQREVMRFLDSATWLLLSRDHLPLRRGSCLYRPGQPLREHPARGSVNFVSRVSSRERGEFTHR